MKKIRNIASLVLALVVLPSISLYADALFLKEGGMEKGTIEKHSVDTIVIRTRDGEKTYTAAEVAHVQYTKEYKKQRRLYLKSGDTVTGHIVGEDRAYYYVRKDLDRPDEERVRKESVSFIARKRIRSLEPNRAFLRGEESMFRNLLGFRLITGVSFYPAGPERDLAAKWVPLGFSVFYMDRFFEGEAEIFFPLGGVKGHYFALTGLPFNMFNVGIGVTLGFMSFKEYPKDGYLPAVSNPVFDAYMDGMVFGISYRLPNLFRFSFAMVFSMSHGFEVWDGITYHDYHDTYGDEFTFNFLTSIEFWVWKGLSVKLSWLSYRLKGYDSAGTGPFGFNATYHNDVIMLSVGYAFQMGK